MHKPPEKPPSLRPNGITVILPKPTLIIECMEQKPYSFKHFSKWVAAIERKKLAAGDYSVGGLEDRVAVERKSLQDLFNCCSPYHSREAFVWAGERLGKFDFVVMVIEGSISKILRSKEFSSMHPNAVFGTIQALAVRWGIQPWFAPTRALAEELTACLLHKAYQLIALEEKGLPRRFVEEDIGKTIGINFLVGDEDYGGLWGQSLDLKGRSEAVIGVTCDGKSRLDGCNPPVSNLLKSKKAGDKVPSEISSVKAPNGSLQREANSSPKDFGPGNIDYIGCVFAMKRKGDERTACLISRLFSTPALVSSRINSLPRSQ